MIFATFFVAAMLFCCRTAAAADQIPLVVASQGSSGDSRTSNLLPEIESPINRGRGDIEIEEEEPPRGYFYPKPAVPFNLPEFKPLGVDEPLVGSASFAGDDSAEVERLPRSPRRPYGHYRPSGYRPPNFHSPPQFVPGFIPPNNIRPLPALYGRPGRY